MRIATKTIINPKINAPNAAEKVILNEESSIEKKLPPISAQATSKLEPEVKPRIDGPANGLFKKVCNNNPQTASAVPEIIAISNSGIRKTVSSLYCTM